MRPIRRRSLLPARARSVPLEVQRIADPAVAALYARRLVLVRPDGHVAWRADALPEECGTHHRRGAGRGAGEPHPGGRMTTIPLSRDGPAGEGPARSLTSAVFLQLRAEILACRLAPGQKLRIAALAQRFGVSLAAVREALSRLTADGLVTAEDQRGFRVSLVSLDDFLDITRTRIDIECLALERAIAAGDAEWERTIRALWQEFRGVERKEPARPNDRWGVMHNRFHVALVAACGSEWLLRFRRTLLEQSERYRRLALMNRDMDRDLEAEHLALMTATLDRDAARAQALMRKHLARTAQVVHELPDGWFGRRPARPGVVRKTLPQVVRGGAAKAAKRRAAD